MEIIREFRDALFEYRFLVEDRYDNFKRQAPVAKFHAMYARDGFRAECRNLGNTDELLGESLNSWLSAVPGFGVAISVLLLPGLLLGWTLGLRRIWMMSLAPVLTASLVAVSTLVCWWLHVDWQIGVFFVATVVCAGATFILVHAGARLWPKFFSWDRGEQSAPRAYWIALLASGTVLSLRYAQIVEDPANIKRNNNLAQL